MDLHKQERHLDGNVFLHVSTDQAVVGSEGWIVKSPVVQVILRSVKVPMCGQIHHSHPHNLIHSIHAYWCIKNTQWLKSSHSIH